MTGLEQKLHEDLAQARLELLKKNQRINDMEAIISTAAAPAMAMLREFRRASLKNAAAARAREIVDAEKTLRWAASDNSVDCMNAIESAGVTILGELDRLRLVASAACPTPELQAMLDKDDLSGDEMHDFIDLCHEHFETSTDNRVY